MTVTDERPTDVKGRLKSLNDALSVKRAEIERLNASESGVKFEEKGAVIDPQYKADLRKALDEAEEIKSIVVELERASALGDFLDAPAAGVPTPGSEEFKSWIAEQIAAGTQTSRRMGRKSLGALVTESAEFKAMRESGSFNMIPFKVEGSNVGQMGYQSKDVFTAAGGTFTVPAFGNQQNDGLVVPAYRTQRIRDLFPVAQTTANLIEYVRRTGYVNNARPVAERTAADGTAATGATTDVFGLKPPSNLTFTSEQAPVRVIAHTIDVSKTLLDDEPRLQDTINGEMLYGLRLTEDAQVLYGDGTGSNLLGVMNTPGIQAYHQADGPPTDYKSDAIRRAATRVMLAYYEATGLVLHPFDWEDTELEKDGQNRYVVTMNVAIGADQQLWRLPVVATPAMTEGQFLVGAFGLGAKLYDREQATVAVSTETRDLFDRNAVCIRVEERVALEVPRPEAFVGGTFT